MTATVDTHDPSNGAENIGLRPFITASVAGEILAPVTQNDVTLSLDGVLAIINGITQPGFDASFLANADFGVDVTVRARAPLSDDAWHSVRVQGPDLDYGWGFRTIEATAPRLISVSPALNEDAAPGYPLVQFDIVDDSHGVALRVLEEEADDGELSGSQITAGVDFSGGVGKFVEIDGNPAFIIAVLGPNIAVTSHSGSGTGLNVKLYKRRGIDVTIGGARVIATGAVLDGSGWDASITETSPGRWQVVAQKIGDSIPAGTRVDIDVLAQDANEDVDNASRMRSHFYVGDVRGPRVALVTPTPGTRGLSTATTTQPEFDIVDSVSDVDQATINVYVDGVAAIVAGAAAGDFSTSMVVAIAGGFRVTLIKSTDWPGPHEVHVSVTASDLIGNELPEISWLWHFGDMDETFTADEAGGELVSDDVIRVVAFDFSQSSFARPADREHTGYAHDGKWYEAGAVSPDVEMASWFDEASGVNRSTRESFPISGYLVVAADSWSILDASGRMWMRCSAFGSGSVANWSLAGGVSQALTDGAVAEDLPVFFLAAGVNLIVVDFTSDKGYRSTAGGLAASVLTIDARDSDNAAGAIIDTGTLLTDSATAFARVSGVAFARSWIVVGARDANLEMVGIVDSDTRDAIIEARGALPNSNLNKGVVLPIAAAAGATWARVRMSHRGFDGIEPMIAGFTASGAARVTTADWLAVYAYLQGAMATIASPLPSEDLKDIDQTFDEDGNWIMAAGTTERALLLDVADNGLAAVVLDDLSLADLTLDTVASGELSSVGLGEGFALDRGYLFAAATAVADGKVVRFRHQPASHSATGQITTLASGAPVRALAVLGEGLLGHERFVRAHMTLTALSESYVRAHMSVE